MKLIGTVESIFTISNRGTVVATVHCSEDTVRTGDRIHLKTQSGALIESEVLAIELIKKIDGPCQEAYLLAGQLPQTKIPVGTEIWLL